MMRVRLIPLLLPLIALFGSPVYTAEAGPISPLPPTAEESMPPPNALNSQRETEDPRALKKIPEVRDPTRGMYDPETAREGDSRTLNQLSRDRLDIEGKRSRSLDDLSSPLRERRRIDQSRGRLREPGERIYGTPALRDRLSVPDSRRDYRIDSTRDLRQEYIEESGGDDYRVYRTR